MTARLRTAKRRPSRAQKAWRVLIYVPEGADASPASVPVLGNRAVVQSRPRTPGHRWKKVMEGRVVSIERAFGGQIGLNVQCP